VVAGRRRVVRPLAVLGGGLAAACLLAACSSSSTSSAAASKAAGAAVTIGYENNGADPSLITIHNGYFQKEMHAGVTTKIFTSGPAALSAIASGSLQFMCGIGLPR